MALISQEAIFSLIFAAIILLFVIIVIALLSRVLLRILHGKFGRRVHRQKLVDVESPRDSYSEYFTV